MIVAFIPARGGSKRLPRKNVKHFAGRPLLYYSIALAKSLPQIDRCIVSTEDAEIARVARSCGAEVMERPVELAGDHSTTVSVAQSVLQSLSGAGERPHTLVTLQPNCPLRPVSLLEKALDLFASTEDVDSVVSVTGSTHKLGEIENGYFVPHYQVGMRSQDMAPQYFENGLVYVSQAGMVLEQGDLFGRRILPLETDALYAMGDIDTELDMQIAEFLYEKYRAHFEYSMPLEHSMPAAEI
jgi:CMP-N-acetylneuraminic acid synthetase